LKQRIEDAIVETQKREENVLNTIKSSQIACMSTTRKRFQKANDEFGNANQHRHLQMLEALRGMH
jgi:hypothetical protein